MPTRRVEFHPEAVSEARGAFEWYQDRNESAAQAFLAELDAAVSQITESPERWPVFVKGTRRYLFRRFPFFLVYRVTDDVVQVAAVAHARRQPGYWRSR